MPGSPSVRDIDAAFLGAAPGALAVSDDGAWIAGVWPGGVYAFGAAGQVNLLPVDAGAQALAFLHRRNDLVAAAPGGIFTVTDVGGSAVPSLLYDSSSNPLAPLTIGVSFDNRRVVLTDPSGGLLAIDLSDGSSANFDCACSPEGLFGMGGPIFRLTGWSSGALKLFDAGSGDVLIVPPAQSGGQQ